jgi:exodeoxyribonuclease-5
VDIQLTKDQEEAKGLILDWYSDTKSKDTYVVSGYAGTGKTTLLGQIRDELRSFGARKVAFICYTGKASVVLKKKLSFLSRSDYKNDFCGTIHSLIYEPIIDRVTKEITGWRKRNDIDYNLIIVDEGSMLDKKIYQDLTSYKIKLLIFGDHFQLPPISDSENYFNIMESPDFIITEIVRQEKDNPIIQLSMKLRQYEDIPFGQYGESVAKVHRRHHKDIVSDFVRETKIFTNTLILCGFNRTRCLMNESLRKHFCFTDPKPQVGDRVICLKNNWTKTPLPIANGMLGTVKTFLDCDDYYDIEINFDDEIYPYSGYISKDTFANAKPELKSQSAYIYTLNSQTGKDSLVKTELDFFDYGYCLTVHKAQGSQASRVLLIEEPCKYWDGDMWFRWLYTGITRSSKQLLIVR